MGKLMIRNNEQSLIRNFTYIVHVYPNGHVSRPVKCDHWVILGTGEDRVLEVIHEKPKPPQLRLSGDRWSGVALGALGMWFAMTATAFFL